MSIPGNADMSRLCLHTMTNRPWSLEKCVEHYRRAGIRGISVWRNVLQGLDLNRTRILLENNGMVPVSLVRGGFFASADPVRREMAIRENLLCIREAGAIGAPLVVMVCGADPVQSMEQSRSQIMEGIGRILPEARERGVRLAIEPLHPMYAADRSAIVTMAQANDMTEEIGSDNLGVAVDVFHLWWDRHLENEIMRCGRLGKLFAFHVCDWKPGMTDLLNDRGLMGEGCIDLKRIRKWMEEAGFGGYIEVEIFSDRYWQMEQEEYLDLIVGAYLEHC
jgi:sugar phosphate isomerase/epimerase